MPNFDEVARAIAGIPFMSPAQGRLVYDHVRDTGATDVLELGTAHGVGAAYMAAAGANVTTVDFAGAALQPAPGGGRAPRRASPSASRSCASTPRTRGG